MFSGVPVKRVNMPVSVGPATAFTRIPDLAISSATDPENIGVERGGIAFRGLVRDRTNLALGAGIVHCDIETTKPRDRLVDQSADVILLADVGVDELGLRPEGPQLLGERLARLITPAGDNHFCPLLGEGDGGGAPNAGEFTGDQYD